MIRTCRNRALRWFAASIAGVIAAGAMPALAQSWPQKPVSLIVSQGPGSSPDVFARLISERLQAALNQPVIVENKPGGGNIIGAQAAARAAPDGYTFFFATSAALVSNPFMMKDLPYNPLKDFVPVALITRSHQVLVAHPDVAATTLPELIALDKKEPGKLAIAVDGPRNLAGVVARALNKRAGTQFNDISYPNIKASLQDVITARVPLGVYSISVAEAMVRDGKLKVIATASADKNTTFPNAPTIAQTLPGFDFLGWFMVMAPAGTPPAIVAEMNKALQQAAGAESVRAMAPKIGFDMDPKGLGTPEAASQFLKAQMELWAKTTSELGIVPE